jgi:hypothetical protein
MAVTVDDLLPLNTDGKRLALITPDVYTRMHNNRHLEHGHNVDMFNAPDPSGDTVGGYSLGFFITRLCAKDPDKARQKLAEVLKGHSERLKAEKFDETEILSPGHDLVAAIIDVLAIHAGVADNTRIRFHEQQLDNQVTVGDIKIHYGSLLRTWWLSYPIHWPETMIVTLHPGGLDWYVDKLFSAPNPPKIVVMGHTHHALSKGNYDNDGCWSRDAGDDLRYVQIVGDEATLVDWP